MRMMKSWLSIFEFWELEFAFSFTFDKNHCIVTKSHTYRGIHSKVHLIVFLVLYGLYPWPAYLVDCTDLHFVEIDDEIIYVVP